MARNSSLKLRLKPIISDMSSGRSEANEGEGGLTAFKSERAASKVLRAVPRPAPGAALTERSKELMSSTEKSSSSLAPMKISLKSSAAAVSSDAKFLRSALKKNPASSLKSFKRPSPPYFRLFSFFA